MRRLASLVAFTLAAAAGGTAGVPAGAKAPEIAPVPAGIARLLDDRARAFASKDRDLLAGTLEPGEFQRRELAAFDNAGPLPFDVLRLRAMTQFSADIASPRVKALYPGREVLAYQVQEESSFGGFEKEPYIEDSFLTFVRSRPEPQDAYEGWRTASGSDFDSLGAFSAFHVWNAAPVATAQSEHFLLVSHPDQIGRVRTALDVAEQAYAEVRKFWPRPLDSRFVVIVPSTTAELAKLLQTTFDLSKFVAFAAATNRRDEGWAPAGVRIFLQLSHFERYDDAGKRVILAHELVHAVSRPVTGPFFPTWVEEGLAMHATEKDNGLATARRGPAPPAFPADDAFFVGPTGDIIRVYRLAQTAVGTLAERSKVEGVVRFYEALGQRRVTPGTKEFHVGQALKESVGWTVEEWTKAWRDRLG